MFQTHRTIYFILAILAAVGIAVGLLFAIQNFKTEEEVLITSTPLQAGTPAGQERLKANDDEMKNWQTYRNEEYGFEFATPITWHSEDTGGGVQLSNWPLIKGQTFAEFKPDQYWLDVSLIPKYSDDDLLTLIKRRYDKENFEPIFEVVELDGQTVIKYSYSVNQKKYRFLTYAIPHPINTKRYVEIGVLEPFDTDVLNKILSTFKFVD